MTYKVEIDPTGEMTYWLSVNQIFAKQDTQVKKVILSPYDSYVVPVTTFEFESEEEAMLFTLRWK